MDVHLSPTEHRQAPPHRTTGDVLLRYGKRATGNSWTGVEIRELTEEVFGTDSVPSARWRRLSCPAVAGPGAGGAIEAADGCGAAVLPPEVAVPPEMVHPVDAYVCIGVRDALEESAS